MKSGAREKLVYVALINCNKSKADCLATVDVDMNSPTHGQIIHTLDMPYAGDELHHYGWNTCSSCCGDASKMRRFLVLPGQITSRIYIVDTIDERAPKIHKIIEPSEVMKWNLSAPHTLHCLPNGEIMISMLGDAKMNAPGGFLVLNADFSIKGRWSEEESKMHLNHDFWYQPAHNVMVSTEFAAPAVYAPGFKLSDLGEGKYGTGVCFWNWEQRTLIKRVNLHDEGKVTLAARFLHDPKSSHGYFVSNMSGNLWHFFFDEATRTWQVKKRVQLEGVQAPGWPIPVPAFSGDLVISLDDRFLFVSNWFNGDIRQYDISEPSKPTLVGQVWCGASYTKAGEMVSAKRAEFHNLQAGPHMMQLSLDGKRLYVTNSFLSTWDDIFYPNLEKKGSALIRINVDTTKGGLEIDESFFVDFGKVNGNTYRAHEIRYPGGDCTSDIWLDQSKKE